MRHRFQPALDIIVHQVCGVESGQLGLLSKDFSVIQEAAIMALRPAFHLLPERRFQASLAAAVQRASGLLCYAK
jgi:hypothetical protein